jgi:hypothetical protein
MIKHWCVNIFINLKPDFGLETIFFLSKLSSLNAENSQNTFLKLWIKISPSLILTIGSKLSGNFSTSYA